MGRLSGFKYREIIKRLKRLGFEFDRQAAGSHEIWFNSETGRYTDCSQPLWRYARRNITRHFEGVRNNS